MYIEFLAPSPKQGQTEHISREAGVPLIAAGFAKEVSAPPRNIVPVIFGVFKGALETTPIALFCKCDNCGRSDHYIGVPDVQSIAQGFTARLCVHAKSTPVPEDVRQAYAAVYKPNPLGWNSGVPGISAPSASTPGEQRYGLGAGGKILK
jgi:hypothetical protein